MFAFDGCTRTKLANGNLRNNIICGKDLGLSATLLATATISDALAIINANCMTNAFVPQKLTDNNGGWGAAYYLVSSFDGIKTLV